MLLIVDELRQMKSNRTWDRAVDLGSHSSWPVLDTESAQITPLSADALSKQIKDACMVEFSDIGELSIYNDSILFRNNTLVINGLEIPITTHLGVVYVGGVPVFEVSNIGLEFRISYAFVEKGLVHVRLRAWVSNKKQWLVSFVFSLKGELLDVDSMLGRIRPLVPVYTKYRARRLLLHEEYAY